LVGWLTVGVGFLGAMPQAGARIWSADDGTSPIAVLVPELSLSNATASPPYEATLFVPDEGTGVIRNAPTAAVFRNTQGASGRTGSAAKDTRQEVRATSRSTGAIYAAAFATGENRAAPPSAKGARSYYAAFAKAGTRFGPSGPGGIYIREASGATRPFVTIPNVISGPPTADGAGDGATVAYVNGVVYKPQDGGIHTVSETTLSSAGQASLGDLALDPTERWLYVVNLHDRNVYEIDTWATIPTAAILQPLPALAAPTSCAARPSDLQPGGLTVTSAGHLLVGTVCTARGSGRDQDVSADVWSFDIETRTWADRPVFHTDFGGPTSGAGPVAHWATPIVGTQPADRQLALLSLDVTESGNLLVGFRNRGSDAAAAASTADAGLVLRAAAVEEGWADPYIGRPAGQVALTPTNLLGAVAATPGSTWGQPGEELAATARDGAPARTGVVWLDRTSAQPAISERAADAADAALPGAMGDISLLAGWRSVTTTVFDDANGDGVQQPGEAGIDGARLTVNIAGQTTTSAVVTTAMLGAAHGQVRLYVPPFDRYQIQVDPTTLAPGGIAAGRLRSTPPTELRLGIRSEHASAPAIGLTSAQVLAATAQPVAPAAALTEVMPAAGRGSSLLALFGALLLTLGVTLVILTRLPMKPRSFLDHAGTDGKDRVA
jgi:hypothetical protein